MDQDTNQEMNTEENKPVTATKRSNLAYIVIGIVAVILIVIIGGLTWLYTGSVSSAKEKVFNTLSLPAAFVDMKAISAKTVIARVDLAKQLATAQETGEEVVATDIYDQLLDTKKVEVLASNRDISVTDEAINEEYQNIIKQYAAGDEEGFKGELEKTYQMSPNEFKDEVIRQELLQSQLLIWYNKQEDLNKATYDTTRDLQSKLDSGQSFDEVAKTYTQDESTKDFAGDSGVILYDDLLPEFRDALNDAKVGDIKMVVSRYGNHILKVLELNNDGENGAKQIHLQQVFVKQVGFTEWLAKESENVKVTKLLKF